MTHRSKKAGILSYCMFILAATFYFYEFFLQVSPAIMANDLMRDFGITATTLGIISGVYFYSYTAMQLPAGLLYDRLGPRKVITVATLCCALGACLFGMAPNVYIAGLARFLMGIGSACAFIGVLTICLNWFPVKYFAIGAGITQTLGSIGAIAGQAPLAILINHYSWRSVILALAIIGVAISFVILLLLRDHPKDYVAPAHHKAPSVGKSLKIILSNPQTWTIGIYSLMIWTPVPIFAALWGVPFLMTKYHISNVFAGSISSMLWLGTAIGSPLAGWIAIRHGKRLPTLIGCAVLGLVSATIVIYVNHLAIFFAYILLFFVGCASGAQALAFGVVKDNNKTNVASTAMGFNNMAVVFGGAIFQPLVGKILDHYWTGGLMPDGTRLYSVHSFEIALVSVPVCFLLAIVVANFFIRETYCAPLPDEA